MKRKLIELLWRSGRTSRYSMFCQTPDLQSLSMRQRQADLNNLGTMWYLHFNTNKSLWFVWEHKKIFKKDVNFQRVTPLFVCGMRLKEGNHPDWTVSLLLDWYYVMDTSRLHVRTGALVTLNYKMWEAIHKWNLRPSWAGGADEDADVCGVQTYRGESSRYTFLLWSVLP